MQKLLNRFSQKSSVWNDLSQPIYKSRFKS